MITWGGWEFGYRYELPAVLRALIIAELARLVYEKRGQGGVPG